MPKINLLDCSLKELELLFLEMGEKAFRAKQLFDWIYKKGIFDLDQMSNLSDSLKKKIKSSLVIGTLRFYKQEYSSCDNSYKFLFKCMDGHLIESVLILSKARSTLCVSCMIGCPLKCKFCATGTKLSFKRGLKLSEILGQVFFVKKFILEKKLNKKLTNVVFMGMGEPLLNLKNVKKALELLIGAHGFLMSRDRITISTAGVIPGLFDIINEFGVKLAVSLHFPTDEERTRFMPINERFPIKSLISEVKKIGTIRKNPVTIEYLMIDGVNDTLLHAKKLIKLLHGTRSKVNLIPFNKVEGLNLSPSIDDNIELFFNYLKERSMVVTVRRSKGGNIEGACGQLVSSFGDNIRAKKS